MKKKNWGKVQHTDTINGNTLRSARIERGNLHLVTHNEGYNNALCRTCYQPINTTFDTKVKIMYISFTVKSGTMTIPVVQYWHYDCATIGEVIPT